MKRLFVCCDGTWDAPTDLQDGVPVPTNVCKFYNALADVDGADTAFPVRQLRYYHPGVGTEESWLRRAWDGATGNGLSRTVRSAYKWLADHYAERDQIFLLGFSRGAFTARSVAGFITHCGLPPSPSWSLVAEAFALYRLDPRDPATADKQAKFKREHPSPPRLAIHFVGVWDTVGALGIPRKFDLLDIEWRKNRFHDTQLSPLVRHAYQALAIDEVRSHFEPTLWTGAPAAGQKVEQAWFAGEHADVGGGYQENALSDLTLQWMFACAAQCGAMFRPDMVKQLRPDPLGVVHDSSTWLFSLPETQPRSFPDLAAIGQVVATEQRVHPSVAIRRADPPITRAPYRNSRSLLPGAEVELNVYARQFWNWTGVYLEAGATYEFSALGEWQDGGQVTGPDGTRGNVLQMLLTPLKRYRQAKWFCLVGCIGDAGNPSVAGDAAPMTTFAIGGGTILHCQKPGYLYCYANDARRCYANNRGSVSLGVKRTS